MSGSTASNITLALSRTELVGAQGYTFEVLGLTDDQLNRGHFVHSIVGMEDVLLDHFPAYAMADGAMPLGAQKYVQTGWFGAFAQLPTGTHTHRLEAWIAWDQDAPIVIEQEVTVQDPIAYFSALNQIYYADLSRPDKTGDWPGTPTGTPVRMKLNTLAEINAVFASKNTGGMVLIRGEVEGTIDFSHRNKSNGVYLTSYDGRAKIKGGLTGVTDSGEALWPFSVVEGLDFESTGDVIGGNVGQGAAGIADGVKNWTKTLSVTYAGITMKNMNGLYPTDSADHDAELVVFNSKITDWMDIGIFVRGKVAACGNFICQNPLTINGVEGKSGNPAFPDHGCIRSGYALTQAYNKNMFFTCNGWSMDNSAVSHKVAAHQPCLRLNSGGDAGLRCCIMGNFFEGCAMTIGKGASSDSNYPAEIVTVRHNIMLATAAMSAMINCGTTNVFIADNMYIVPKVKRFVGNTVRFFNFGLSTQGATADPPIDVSMYEGKIWVRNNTILDLREGVTDPLSALIENQLAAAAKLGIATHDDSNAIFVPNRAPSDVGAPYMSDPDVMFVQSALVPQFWGLRQRYTKETLNDTLVADDSYATPSDAVQLVVPQTGAKMLTASAVTTSDATLFDLFGNRRTAQSIGAISASEISEPSPSITAKFRAAAGTAAAGKLTDTGKLTWAQAGGSASFVVPASEEGVINETVGLGNLYLPLDASSCWVAVDILRHADVASSAGGLLLCADPAKTANRILVNWQRAVGGWSLYDGETLLGVDQRDLPLNTTVRLRVQRIGTRVTALLDDVEILSGSVSASGTVAGLRVANKGFRFRNFAAGTL